MSTSPFVSFRTQVIPFPGGEPGHTVTIRPLGWKALRDAAQKRATEGLRFVGDVGPALLKEVENLGGREGVEKAAAAEDPVASYAWDVVLRQGIVSWNIDDEGFDPAKVDDLSEAVAEALVRAILKASGKAKADEQGKG